MEAFGGSLGIHKKLVKGLLVLPGQVRDPSNITMDEQAKAKEEEAERVNPALLISRANKRI